MIKSMLHTAYVAVAVSGVSAAAVAAPITPTVKLLPDDLVTIQVELAETRGAWESGVSQVATIEMEDGTAYDAYLTLSADDAEPMLATTTFDGTAPIYLAFNLHALPADNSGPAFAHLVDFAADGRSVGSVAGPVRPTFGARADIDAANLVGTSSGVIGLALIQRVEGTERPVELDPAGASHTFEAQAADFGGLSATTTVSAVHITDGEIAHAPITPTVKRAEAVPTMELYNFGPAPEEPVRAPIIPTIRLREPRGAAFQASVWGN